MMAVVLTMTRMTARVLLTFGLLWLASIGGWGQEIRLESCRQLPMVKATVGERQFQFLLDTGAAATLLNLKSFSSQETAEIDMDSWNGVVATRARKVTLKKFTVGERKLENLSLLAVDLTPVERSCQRRVDGVLGADLIARLGLTIDLKNHIGTLNEGEEAHSQALPLDQLAQQQAACQQAFNRSDAKAFEECLDPEIVLLTSKGDYRGRDSVMRHFKESYFDQDPPVVVAITPRSRRAIGPVIWVEYELSLTRGPQVMTGRGTAIYRKTGDRWLMANMDFPVAQAK